MAIIIEWFVNLISSHPIIFIGGFVIYVVVYIVSILVNRKKPGRNPFWKNHEKPRADLVTDIKARDAVIKQRFTAAKLPENVDVIVIGSGYGGLSAAALLSLAGLKVVVLEQHDQAGGCCHTYYSKKGFEFDTGIHYVGGMGDHDFNRFLLNQMTNGQLDWILLDDAYDTVMLGDAKDNRRYKMLRGKEVCIRELKKDFPKDHKAIEKYIELVLKARSGYNGVIMLKYLPKWLCKILIFTGIIHLFTDYFKYSEQTVTEVLNTLTDNQELKATLCYIFGDYGVPPKDAPFSMHATVVGHYLEGAYYPKGGPSEIAFHTVPVIEMSGGRVLVQAPVSKIIIDDNGRAVGVTVKRSTGDVDIKARYIVSNAGAINTFKHLLPKQIACKSSIYPYLNKVGPSISFLTVFLGLEGTHEELGITAGNIWYFTEADIDTAVSKYLESDVENVGQEDLPLLYISSPSAKDPSFPERFPGHSVMLVISVAKYDWFKDWNDERVKHRGDDYNALKDRIGERIIQQCVKINPKLENKITLLKVGTPVTNNYYLGTKQGEMYGLDHDKKRFSPEVTMEFRPKTDIPGLYLTGQDVLTCGFVSVMYSGVLAASAILHRNLITDLATLRKNVIEDAKGKKKSA